MARGRRFEGRVQTPDLAAPEPIRPGPIKRDTYERAQREVVDTSDSKRLVQALGIAKGLVGPAMSAIGKAQAEATKARQEHDFRRWNHWLSTTEQSEQLDLIKSGKAPTSSDPHVQAAIEKHHGFLTARRLAAEVDKDIAERKLPFGTNQFNPDKYVVDKAVDYANGLVKSKHAMFAFRKTLDHFRKDLAARHTRALGIANTRKIETTAADTINGALQQAYGNFGDVDPSLEGVTVEQASKGQRILDSLRSTVYKELGPRMNGGSLDLKYGRMDELLLDILKEHAKNPKYAKTVMEILTAQRKEILNRGETRKPQDIGPLWNIYRHQGKLREIQETADKSLWNNFQAVTKQKVLDVDTSAVESRNGQFFHDIEVPYGDGKRSVKISGAEREEQAYRNLSEKYRLEEQQNNPNYKGGPVQKELDLYIDNGVKHEEMVTKLDRAVVGFLNSADNKPDPNAIAELQQQAIKLGTSYKYMVDKAPGTRGWFKAHTQKFFEAYRLALNTGVYSPAQAVVMAQQALLNKDGYDPKFTKAQVETALNNIDVSDKSQSWWNILGLGTDSEVANPIEARKALKEHAELIVRVTGKDPEKALAEAAKEISNNAVRVNGSLIINEPGLNPHDSEHFQYFLKNFHKTFAVDLADRYDVDKPEELSVRRKAPGVYVIISRATQLPVTPHPYNKKGEIVGPQQPGEIRVKNIQQRRAYQKHLEDQKAIQKSADNRQRAREHKFLPKPFEIPMPEGPEPEGKNGGFLPKPFEIPEPKGPKDTRSHWLEPTIKGSDILKMLRGK